jgi:6-phosphogluconolactonase
VTLLRLHSSPPDVVVSPDLEALARAAAKHVRAAAAKAIARRGRFRLALAGGSTPRALYRVLASEPGSVDWRRTDVFFGDERAVPPDDPASNYRMARETLLEPAAVPPANVRRLRGEDPDLDATARAYETTLTAGAVPPWLDLVLLGIGPDGHTASLFPDSDALDERQRLCVAVAGAPAPSARRLTLTYPVFADAAEVLFMVAGSEKAAALRDVLAGPEQSHGLPAQLVVRRPGPVAVLCDRDAAALLPKEIHDRPRR